MDAVWTKMKPLERSERSKELKIVINVEIVIACRFFCPNLTTTH